MCVCVCVCVCPAGLSDCMISIDSYESLSLLSAGSTSKGIKVVTLSSLQVKSYLSALTTRNTKYDLGISLSHS